LGAIPWKEALILTGVEFSQDYSGSQGDMRICDIDLVEREG
jgi:hypothetical protein